jgi:hypothetical protein
MKGEEKRDFFFLKKEEESAGFKAEMHKMCKTGIISQ